MSDREWRTEIRRVGSKVIGLIDRITVYLGALGRTLLRRQKPDWIYDRVWRYRYTATVVLVAVGIFSVLTYVFLARHHAYMTTGSDLGAYVHMFSSTVSGDGWLRHGKYRVSHPDGSYWGAHFSLTLLGFIPVFALFPDATTLLVVKSLVLASSIVVLWLVADRTLERRPFAFAFVLSYAFNPFLWTAWMFDFQEQILIPIFVFLSYYCYVKRRYGWFLVAVGLLLLTNEFLVPIVAGYLFGLGVISYREGRLAEERVVLLSGLGLTAAVKLLAEFVIGRFSVDAGVPVRSVAVPIREHTDEWRLSLTELVVLQLTNPELLVASFTHDLSVKATFLLLFLLPVLFLVIFDESAVLAIIPFLVFGWFFAGRPVYYEFGAHYPFYLLPFLYIGALGAVRSERASIVFSMNWRTLLAGMLVMNLLVGLALDPSLTIPETDERVERVDAAIDTIPENATLVTQNNIYPHVATRPNATYVAQAGLFQEYNRKYGPVEPEYILLDLSRGWSSEVIDGFGDRLDEEYGLYRYEGTVFVYMRGYEASPERITNETGGVETTVSVFGNDAQNATEPPPARHGAGDAVDVRDGAVSRR